MNMSHPNDLCTYHFTIDTFLPRPELVRLVGVVLLVVLKAYLTLLGRADKPTHLTVFPSYGIRSLETVHLISSIGLSLSLTHTVLWFIFYSCRKSSGGCLQYACMLQDDYFQACSTIYFVFFVCVALIFNALRRRNAIIYANGVSPFLQLSRAASMRSFGGGGHSNLNRIRTTVLVIAGAGRGVDAFPLVKRFLEKCTSSTATTPTSNASDKEDVLYDNATSRKTTIGQNHMSADDLTEIYCLDSYNSKYFKESSEWIMKNAVLEGLTIERYEQGADQSNRISTPSKLHPGSVAFKDITSESIARSDVKLIESTLQRIPLDNSSVDIFATPLGGPSFVSIPDVRGLLSTSRKFEIYFDEVYRVLKDDGIVLTSICTLFGGDFKKYLENTKKFSVIERRKNSLIWNFIYPTKTLILRKNRLKKHRGRSRTYEEGVKILQEDTKSRISLAKDDYIPSFDAQERLRSLYRGIHILTFCLILLWIVVVTVVSYFFIDLHVPPNFPYGYTVARFAVNNLGSVPIGLYFVWKNTINEVDKFSLGTKDVHKIVSQIQIEGLERSVNKIAMRNIVILFVVSAVFTTIFWLPIFFLDLVLLDSTNSKGKYDTKSIQGPNKIMSYSILIFMFILVKPTIAYFVFLKKKKEDEDSGGDDDNDDESEVDSITNPMRRSSVDYTSSFDSLLATL